MLEELLIKEEGKTIEFKENTQSLQKIVQTLIAFANTAGGTIIIGVKDKTKEVVGLENILEDEEKIANAVAATVEPLLIPTFQFHTWRKKDILIVSVPHSFGPFYLKAKGVTEGTFMRLGSTNRIADASTIQEISRLKEHKHFDEQPNVNCPLDRIQFDLAEDLFAEASKKFTKQTAQSLDLIVSYQTTKVPSNGAILLFGSNHREYFPDAIIRLGRFEGADKSKIIDTLDLEVPISVALEPIIMFIRRHTTMQAKIGSMRRTDIPQYPNIAIREVLMNALLHTDYAMKGASITIAIFDDRIEITNPGSLPLGLSLQAALSGISQLRNRVIGRVFRELEYIEAWGSGLKRIIKVCDEHGLRAPKFQELGSFFRVTLFHAPKRAVPTKPWHNIIINYLKKHKEVTAKQAQEIWQISSRSATSRLKQMVEQGLLVELGTSVYDPYKTFHLVEE